MPRRSRRPLATVATATLVGAVLLGGGGAWAAWSVSGGGSGAVAAGSLVTPVLTATSSTTSPSSAIDLSWTAPGQLAGTTYSVKRDGTTTLACTASPCTDSGLTSGSTHSYVVTANLGGNWAAPSNTASAGTTSAAVSTTTTVQSSTSPAKSGATVTLTATVTATSGTPIGTVAFKDGAGTIPCTGGSQTLSSGQAICDTSFPTTGLHSITAEYSGGAGFLASTSAVFNQRIVNAGVTGIGFTNVVAGTGAGTAIVLNSGNCTGLGTANVTCSITNDRNASLSADVQFVNSSNNLTAYSTSAVTGSSVIATKNTSTSGSLTFAPSGSGSPRLSGTKSGNDHVYFTVSYTDGVNTFTATLKMD